MILLERYRTQSFFEAKKLLRQFTKTGIEIEELISVGLEATIRSLNNYNVNEDTKFYNYWQTVCRNLMMKYIQENSYQCGASMFNGLSLNAITEEGTEYAQLLGQEDSVLSNKYNGIDLYRLIELKSLKLTKLQRNILKMYLDDKSSTEIADILNISKSAVYYNLTRAKEQIAKYLKNKNR